MPNRILDLFDEMKKIEAEHLNEIAAISKRYRVDTVTWDGLTAVWTGLLSILTTEEAETVKELLSLGREKFNEQPLSIRVGFITFPKEIIDAIRRPGRNAGRSLLFANGPEDDSSNKGE